MWNLEMQAVKRARAAITVHGVPLYRIELGDTLGARGDSPALAQICAHRVALRPRSTFELLAFQAFTLSTGFLPPKGRPVRTVSDAVASAGFRPDQHLLLSLQRWLFLPNERIRK